MTAQVLAELVGCRGVAISADSWLARGWSESTAKDSVGGFDFTGSIQRPKHSCIVSILMTFELAVLADWPAMWQSGQEECCLRGEDFCQAEN